MSYMPHRSPKEDRILRIVLNDPGGNLSKSQIAKLADCSRIWVIKFLRKLQHMGLVKDRTVTNYRGLLDYWQGIRPTFDFRDYLVHDETEVVRGSSLLYAFTTYRAEILVQRYLFPSRTDAYILSEDRGKWHKAILDADGLVGKGNLRLIFANQYVFYGAESIQGFRVVSRPQLILDLRAEGGPAVEAADMLLSKVAHNVLRAP
jgi:hypothetical protein